MSNALDFLRFPPLNVAQKIRVAATILYASRIRDWKPLERVLVEGWLRKWSGKKTCEKVWLPLLRALGPPTCATAPRRSGGCFSPLPGDDVFWMLLRKEALAPGAFIEK